MTYYKGLIVENNFKEYEYSDNMGYCTYMFEIDNIDDICLYSSIFSKFNKQYVVELKRLLMDSINRKSYNIKITNINLIQYFNQFYNISNQEKLKKINNISSSLGSVTPIVYELVKDMDGNLYGRELYTKEIFPILNLKCEVFDYSIEILKTLDYHFNLKILPSINISSLQKCGYLIVGHKIADLNDFNKYINKFRGIHLFKRQEAKEIENYKKKIITLSHTNVFREDFVLEEKNEKKEVVKISQSVETTLMEDIEYGLIRLKNINNELYVEYKKKYETLLKKDIIREELASLLGEIEYTLIFKKRDIKEIIDFINNLKKEYLNNFLNHNEKKTDTDLKKIDKINELFLRIKDKFSYQNQREVLKNIAFLYLMEVYENIPYITREELEKSYFSCCLKSIVWWINNLIEEDIIECSYVVSLREEITLDTVIDMIKNIVFKKRKTKVKNNNN